MTYKWGSLYPHLIKHICIYIYIYMSLINQREIYLCLTLLIWTCNGRSVLKTCNMWGFHWFHYPYRGTVSYDTVYCGKLFQNFSEITASVLMVAMNMIQNNKSCLSSCQTVRCRNSEQIKMGIVGVLLLVY